MRVAFVGKGGAGKSVIAGTLARLLAATGESVLVIDSDPMPGLAWSAGLPPTDAGIPEEAVEPSAQRPGPRYRLREGLSPDEAVRRYAAVGPDGLRLLQFGKLRGPDPMAASQAAFRQIAEGLQDSAWHLIGDLPGGTRQPFFGWAGYARTVAVVVQPTVKSLLSARRLAGLSGMSQAPQVVAVVNEARGAGDGELVARRTGLPVIGVVPYDPAVGEADRLGLAPVDHRPDSPAVRAVACLLQQLKAQEDGRR